ncbi:hypothetical protein RR48_03082 [Papilio machaon]|uniref:Uncharacterized protein n=1 Tax=Papilio machaon TaxID=76193 RepID=A0A0N1PHY2_PAPMA|nr:hypothetical protein RR48_03082 [Papilio machaon]
MLTSTIKAITDMGYIMMSLSGLFLVAIVLMLVFTIVLIIGLHKKNDTYIRAYLLCAVIYLIVAATTSFVSFPLLLVSAFDVTYKIVSLKERHLHPSVPPMRCDLPDSSGYHKLRLLPSTAGVSF